MKIVKVIVAVMAAIIAFLGLTALTMRLGWWVKAKYAGPPSQFIQVGDVTLHVRDEGQGPALVMMHSSMTNLREWDAWADRLKTRYRVIRMDWPPYGLSIDKSGQYGMTHVVDLPERFVDQEKIDKFSLIGSSSGAFPSPAR